MKILEIIPQLGSGGAERFTVDLCNELAINNHDVTLLILWPLNVHNFYLDELSEKVKVMSMNKEKGFSLKSILEISRIIKSIHPDVVHTHLRAINYCMLTPFISPRIKYFHTIHSDAAKEAWDRPSSFLRKVLFRTKRFKPITISVESQKSFQQYYGFDAPLILNGRNIPSDVSVSDNVRKEFETFRLTSKTKVLMNLAHLDNVKRQDLLARCVDKLIKEGYDISLILVGREVNMQVVERIKAINNDRIHLLGIRNNPLEYLKLADAFCLSSKYEGLPISLIEALGIGTVPICTPVGGIVNIIHNGINGFIADDISEESYYRALKLYLDTEKSQITNIKKKVLESYKPFSMTECAQNYIKLFRR